MRRHLAHFLIGIGVTLCDAGYRILPESKHPAFLSNGEVDARLKMQRTSR